MEPKGKIKKKAQAYPVRYVILTKRIDNGDEEVFNLEDGDGKTVFKTKEEAKRLLKHDTKKLIELYDNAKDIQCHYTLDDEEVEVTIPIGKREIFVRAKIVGI